jgi:hypothetical protein
LRHFPISRRCFARSRHKLACTCHLCSKHFLQTGHVTRIFVQICRQNTRLTSVVWSRAAPHMARVVIIESGPYQFLARSNHI